MNDVIVYRPYKFHRWLGLFLSFCVPFSFAIAVWCFIEAHWGLGLNFALLSIMWAAVTVFSYNTSKIEVVFDHQGVTTSGRAPQQSHSMLWESTNYAYYGYYRGHPFLLLSANSLNRKEAKRFASRGSYSGKVCIDGVWVIHLNSHKDVASIKELIDSKVACVVHFDS